MKLSFLSIRKPVIALVFCLVLMVLGVIGFSKMEIRFFPRMTMPMITINTGYNGASSHLMESQVTTPIENALAGIDNIDMISSRSAIGRSYVIVLFKLGGDLETQASQVRDKLASIHDRLPPDVDVPIVTVGMKGNSILGIGIQDTGKTPPQLRDYVDSHIKKQLRQVPGVGEVSTQGSSSFALRIWMDPAKMQSYNITAADVKSALYANNLYFPAGSIRGLDRSYSLISKTQLSQPDQFRNIIIKKIGSRVIYIKDIAKVELGTRSLIDYPLRINGKSGVFLVIKPLQVANPIAVANRVSAAVKAMQSGLPAGMKVSVKYNMSTFLSHSIHETFMTIFEAIFLVILVVFLFLGSFRASLVPIVTIPVSMVSVFAVMLLLGFTINVMSLLGMVLAIGLVVDDSIVVLENIHRHVEEGMSPMRAAFVGSKEIAFSVVAMTITLAAVYAPLGFMQGFSAELFREFAFTLAGAVLISGFVSLTLSPMMCSQILLPPSGNQHSFEAKVERVFHRVSGLYRVFLQFMLGRRLLVLGSLTVIAVGGYVIYTALFSELIPKEDQGLVVVSVTSPSGASIDYTNYYVAQVEEIVRKNPVVKSVITQGYSSGATLIVPLKPWKTRHKTTAAVVAELNRSLANIPGVEATVSIPGVVNYGIQGNDIDLNLSTLDDYKSLIGPINKLLKKLRHYPGIIGLGTNLKYDSQQFDVSINRELAAMVGVNVQDIASTMQTMMSGNHWTDIQSSINTYPVMVQMQKNDLTSVEAINKIYVRSGQLAAASGLGVPQGENMLIPLSSLVKLTPSVGQYWYRHYNRYRSGTIYGKLATGYTESEVLKKINSLLPSVISPKVHASYSGKARQFIDASGSMLGIGLMSLVFIYLVLCAQFNSFIDPFIIMLTVPFCIVGALFSLWLSGGTISIYSQIGLVTLVGMITKHGILITQFTNELRLAGRSLTDAIVEACAIRLRPILMTTAAMIFGTLPLALSSGPGSIGRQQIGWVIVGGLFFGTFFSLVVVPIAYSYFGQFKRINKPLSETVFSELEKEKHV